MNLFALLQFNQQSTTHVKHVLKKNIEFKRKIHVIGLGFFFDTLQNSYLQVSKNIYIQPQNLYVQLNIKIFRFFDLVINHLLVDFRLQFLVLSFLFVGDTVYIDGINLRLNCFFEQSIGNMVVFFLQCINC
eukprot:TRINITY_DN9507_c1_g1_i3.p6 TRINITY_DN9507_c1_g1~~TRINITY_DN9507_c1_g1_i3.p6  ORF type:complete len:131 (+),score=0.40 TRINITY_DN9507_c1_g1_i3:1248-1640(+)